MFNFIRRHLNYARLRVIFYFIPLVVLVVAPALAFAQTAATAEPFDLVHFINALPLPVAVKAVIFGVLPIVYLVCAVLRWFVPPTTWFGIAIRFVLDGIKHKDESVVTASTTNALTATPAAGVETGGTIRTDPPNMGR